MRAMGTPILHTDAREADAIDLGGPVDRRVFLVETYLTTSYDPGPTPPTPPSPRQRYSFNATGAFAWASRDFKAPGTSPLPPYEFRFANDTFISRPDDPDRPNEYWDGRVNNPGTLSRAARLTPSGDGSVEISSGTITLDNTDRRFDTVLDQYYAVSQQIHVRYGEHGWNWADFITLWTMRITGVGISETELTLEVTDPVAYAQNFYPVTYYNGIGGIGGSASLANTQRPVVLGQVWNYSPLRIDPVNLVYQIHDGAIIAVSAVFDGGVPLTFFADYTSYAALIAAAIPDGGYATARNLGLLRVKSTPVFTVTAHVQGDADAGITTRSIAAFIAGKLETVVGLDIDLVSFNTLPARTAGWAWTTEQFTYRDILNRFVGDCGYLWGTVGVGPLAVGILQAPTNDTPVRSFAPEDILSLERVTLPAGYESTHKRQVVTYGRNWTVQDISSLAATALESGFRQTEWRTTSASIPQVLKNTIDPPVLQTGLANEADAMALATYLVGLHGVPRKMYSMRTRIFGGLPPLGSQVRLVYPRFGLDGGRSYRVIELSQDFGAGEQTFLLWG